MDSVLKENLTTIDFNQKEKLKRLDSYIYQQPKEELANVWAHTVDDIYSKDVSEVDKNAFVEGFFIEGFTRKGVFGDQKVYSGFIKLLKDEKTSDIDLFHFSGGSMTKNHEIMWERIPVLKM